MIDPNDESTFNAADAMMERGGSFVKILGDLWYHGDPRNREILCRAFEHYFVDYGAAHGPNDEEEGKHSMHCCCDSCISPPKK